VYSSAAGDGCAVGVGEARGEGLERASQQEAAEAVGFWGRRIASAGVAKVLWCLVEPTL
jgi:hypothetical protein